jgi:hypothetical protein
MHLKGEQALQRKVLRLKSTQLGQNAATLTFYFTSRKFKIRQRRERRADNMQEGRKRERRERARSFDNFSRQVSIFALLITPGGRVGGWRVI